MRIRLTPKQIERCERFGADVVDFYASGRNPVSLAVSHRGAEKNPILIGQARMAEWALCKYLDVDPATLEWEMQHGKSWDLLANGCRIDVKHTARRAGRLIWPLKKPIIFDDCDALFLVRGQPPAFEIAGWVTREAFNKHKRIATKADRLDPGTPFMDCADLRKPEAFNDSWEFD